MIKINPDGKLMLYWHVIRKSFDEFGEDDVMTHAAALSYYTIISLPPILIVFLFITTLFYDETYIKELVFEQAKGTFGRDSAIQLITSIEKLDVLHPTFFAKVVGVGAMVFTSTTVFITVQRALNKIFKVKTKPAGWGIIQLAKDRILSFSLLIGVSLILLISFVINTLVVRFGGRMEDWLGSSTEVLTILTVIVIPLLVNVLLFAMIFKFLPDAKLAWRNTWFGAILTSIMFVAGRYLIGYYISSTNVSSLYDTAGSLIVMMVWVFYASTIILYGAVLTYSYIHVKGERVRAVEYAVEVVTVEKEVASQVEG